jgi:taurine dioxygenase
MQPTRFTIQPSSAPLGNEIIGLDLTQAIDEQTFAELREAFNQCSVLVFRNQTLTPDDQVRFSRGFGELEVHVMEKYLLPGHPEIFRVSNIVENGQRIGGSGEFWHTDLSYVQEPSRGSLLYSVEVPIRNGVVLGDTEFASTAAAYDALSDEMKEKLAGLKAIHRYGDIYNKIAMSRGAPLLSEEQKKKTPDVIHPVVLTHPFSGRKSLFVNEGFTVGIVGMADDEAQALLRDLYDHMTQPEFIYRHRWQVGDLVMWDNWATVHRATGGYTPEERRLLHRTTLKASPEFRQAVMACA